jgi:hypothetical protein
MDRNFTPFPNLFFQTDKFFGLPFFNERVYMLNVQKHLPKYTQLFCMLLIVIEV